MKQRKLFIMLTIVSQMLSLPTTMAQDLGKYGNSFLIQEEGLLTMIQRKLSTLDLDKHHKELQAKAKASILAPTPVAGLHPTKEARRFTFDPSYIVTEDIILPDGKLLHSAGTIVNPLDHITLDKKLYFIDGNDESQVAWFKSQAQTISSEDKLILVAGKPFDLEEQLEREVYFDQSGSLVNKFGITQVPAILTQEGKLLRIEEVVVYDR